MCIYIYIITWVCISTGCKSIGFGGTTGINWWYLHFKQTHIHAYSCSIEHICSAHSNQSHVGESM